MRARRSLLKLLRTDSIPRVSMKSKLRRKRKKTLIWTKMMRAVNKMMNLKE